MGPANDKHQATTNRLKLYVRGVIKSEAWVIVLQLKRLWIMEYVFWWVCSRELLLQSLALA